MKADFIVAVLEFAIAISLFNSSARPRAWARKIFLLIGALFLCFVVPTAYLLLVEHKPQLLPFLVADSLSSMVSVGLAVALAAGPSVRSRARKASLALLSTMASVGMLEVFFPALFVVSDGFGMTSSSQLWFAKYWKPINELGYRDVFRPASELESKKLLLVVGDSLVAGHGIKDISDRFSDLLQSKLGPSWAVPNVAQCGWDTKDEWKAIRSYPHRPRMIVLSYFINDIEGACEEGGFPQPAPFDPPAETVKPVIDEFRLANFVYWRIYRFSNAASMGRSYWGYLKRCYENPRPWKIHRDDLLRIVRYCRDNHIRLVAVVFPALGDVEATKPFAAKVAGLLRDNGVGVIEAASLISGEDPAKFMVNPLDAHPNPALNKMVAEILYPTVR